MSTAVHTMTAGELIERALKKSRIIAAQQPIQDKDNQNGLVALKALFKFMQSDSHEWTKEEAVLPLITGQKQYQLGPNGVDCGKADTFVNTTLSANEITSAVVIDVTSSTGMAGAADILASDPSTSTQDWTATDSATLSISSERLLVTNGAASAGGATYDLTTTSGNDYLLSYTYVKGTSASADFTVLDDNGTIITENLSASASSTLAFTARDNTTTFKIANNSSTITETSLLSNLNYVDKASGDRIGVELDDGTRHWDDIVTVDSATQVTIHNGLASASTSGLTVYSYETAIARPVRILSARYASTVAGSELPCDQISRDEYFDQADKSTSGTVNQWYYSPQLTDGELYVWQTAANIKNILRFTYRRPLLVPTATTDLIDFPSEWELPLVWGLAAELGPEYGVKPERQIVLETKAQDGLNAVLDHDVERSSMLMQPDFT